MIDLLMLASLVIVGSFAIAGLSTLLLVINDALWGDV